MSADLLREAAALMRQRAEAATPVPWVSSGGWTITSPAPEFWVGPFTVADMAERNDAEHIASWHPGVALAVADWLELRARQIAGASPSMAIDSHPAIVLAMAYLGRDA